MITAIVSVKQFFALFNQLNTMFDSVIVDVVFGDNAGATSGIWDDDKFIKGIELPLQAMGGTITYQTCTEGYPPNKEMKVYVKPDLAESTTDALIQILALTKPSEGNRALLWIDFIIDIAPLRSATFASPECMSQLEKLRKQGGTIAYYWKDPHGTMYDRTGMVISPDKK